MVEQEKEKNILGTIHVPFFQKAVLLLEVLIASSFGDFFPMTLQFDQLFCNDNLI